MKKKKKPKVIIWTGGLRKKTIKKIIKTGFECKQKGKVMVVITDIVSDALGVISGRYDFVIDSGRFTRM